MKNSKENKKVVFEPISAEEAKKIRAAGNDRMYPPSGLECESGGDRLYDPCEGKEEGEWCCYDDGKFVYGKCHEIYEEGRLRCITGVGYPKKKL